MATNRQDAASDVLAIPFRLLPLFLLPLLLLACDDAPPALPPSVPSPTASPEASPQPLNPNRELAQADELRRNGQLEEAIAVYGTVARATKDEPQRRALWGLAQTYLDLQHYPEAAQVLQALLDRQPEPETARRAHYLLGLALAQTGLSQGAIAAFRAYIDSDGPAQPYARIHLADLLAALGQPKEAAAQLEQALLADLPAPVRSAALLDLGRSYARSGDADLALQAYQRLLDEGPPAADRASALWGMAALYKLRGDRTNRLVSLQLIVREAPSQPQALDALGELELAGAPASLFERAVVLFQHRLNQEAEIVFAEVLAGQPSPNVAGQAHYYLGILAERHADPQAALAQYEAALTADPSGPLAAEAAWWRAQILEFSGRLEEAAGAYTALADAYPQSARAPEASFRAGLIRYRQGRYADAIAQWARYRDSAARPFQQARASYWLGRAARAVGDEASASDYFQQALLLAPWDYYALRAQASLAAEPPPSGDDALSSSPPSPSWLEIEAWLASWAGPEEVGAAQGLLAQPRWQRGEELARAGLSQDAAQEFSALLSDLSSSPWLVYRLLRALYDLGETPSAARAAVSLLQAHQGAPKSLLAVAYPQEFLPIVTAEAKRNGISSMLLLALIRQESLFDPRAASSAGALGLIQIIPTTGQGIAQELGVNDFQTADLLRPNLNIRFGAHYLAAQLRLFEGDLSAALAAYNGGPGNALRWWEQAPEDPDLFLEAIDFSETNLYVQLVLENYALYRYLFNLTDKPSLALP